MTTIVHVRAELIDAGPNDRGTFDAQAQRMDLAG